MQDLKYHISVGRWEYLIHTIIFTLAHITICCVEHLTQFLGLILGIEILGRIIGVPAEEENRIGGNICQHLTDRLAGVIGSRHLISLTEGILLEPGHVPISLGIRHPRNVLRVVGELIGAIIKVDNTERRVIVILRCQRRRLQPPAEGDIMFLLH